MEPFFLHRSFRTPSFLKDHHFRGQRVLPAVEALQILARDLDPDTRSAHAGLDPLFSRNAKFLRFLKVPEPDTEMAVVLGYGPLTPGPGIQAQLSTDEILAQGRMSRRKIHTVVEFCPPREVDVPPLDLAAGPQGPTFFLDSARIYRELVPFGPAFQNLDGRVHLTPAGASGWVQSPAEPGLGGPLGSPFPMDAVFHLACVWGQWRFGVTSYPVGYEVRKIFQPARPQSRLYARVFPRSLSPDIQKYDVWLFDREGRPVDGILNLEMKDLSRGREPAPEWIVQKDPVFSDLGLGLEIVDIEATAPWAEKTFSQRERQRAQALGPERRKAFSAVRLALKRLARKDPDLSAALPEHLETLSPDLERPQIPRKDWFASAAHDHRFASAVAGPRPVGLDVESAGPTALNNRRQFLAPEEETLLQNSEMDPEAAALRFWSIKEAASKALGLPLPQAWEDIRVTRVGSETSQAKDQNSHGLDIHHAEYQGHLFTVARVRE